MKNKNVILYDFNYFGICVQIAYNSYLSGLWGHDGLQTASMASEVKFDLRFEISDLNYPDIYAHVASNSHLSGPWGQGSLQTASMTSKVKFALDL